MISLQEIQAMSEDFISLYVDMENDLITNIAKRFNAVADIKDVSSWQAEKLAQLGALRKDNLAVIAKLTNKTPAEIKKLFTKSGYKTIESDEAIYQIAFNRGLLPSSPLPVYASSGIQRIIEQAVNRMNEYLNLVNTTALQTSSKAYTAIINQTFLETATGVSTYQQSITKAVRALADQGITGADYISKAGRHTRNNIDVAVRRGIVTSAGQLTGQVQEQRAQEWGSNLVEVTSHMGARPEHAEWQGRIFCLNGTDGKHRNLKEATGYGTAGGLKGCNCSHDFYPYFPGISEQTYKPYPLEANNKQYENEQTQRGLERDIRQQKRRVLAAQQIGDTDGEAAATAALKSKQADLRDHLTATGLDRKPVREQIVKPAA